MARQKQGEESARSKLRQWIRQVTENRDNLRLPDIVTEAVSEFRGDAEFVQRFYEESFTAMVYEVAQEYMAGNRAQYIQQVTRSIQEGKQPRSGVFANWMEHAGDRHISLMEMTRRDLYLAAEERQQRGDHELSLATLWRQMAGRLTSPNMKVKTKFKEEEIQRLFEGLKPVEMAIAAD